MKAVYVPPDHSHQKNIVWRLGYGYRLCCCKRFLLVIDSTETTKVINDFVDTQTSKKLI